MHRTRPLGQLLDSSSSSALATPHVPISQRAQAGAGPLLSGELILAPPLDAIPDSAPMSTCNLDLSSFQVPSPYLCVCLPGAPPNLLLPWPSSTSVKCCHNHPIAWTKTRESLTLDLLTLHPTTQILSALLPNISNPAPYFQHNRPGLSQCHLPMGNSINLLAGLLPLSFPVQPSHTPAARAILLKTEVRHATPLGSNGPHVTQG